MAKNKIKIGVEVDDKGNLKQIENKAKKAAKGLNGVAESSKTTDRTLKGTAGASSNTTKNFSKMAQGINGGLVPAYATLAANLFAVSAAFTFLKNAGNLVALQEGQVAYASATGVALRSLSNDIIAATDAQVTFTDASQAAAIGTAAGLQADQLGKLAEGAKNVSILLGRDVTDSFNRLIRGVTKAEPELLDELGIILRLDRATENYSRTINKSAKEFTEFERSQAVAVEVLDQLDSKYTRIAAITQLNSNEFAKLGKAFDDIVNSLKEGAVTVLGPVAEAINKTPQLGIALMGLFAKSVLTAALPAIGNFGEASKVAAKKAEVGYRKARMEMHKMSTTTNRAAGKQAAAQRASKLPALPGAAFAKLSAGKGADLTARQLAGMKSAVNRNTEITKKLRKQYIRELDIMLAATKKSTLQIKQSFEVATSTIGKYWAKTRVIATRALAGIATAARLAATAIGMAFSFLGYAALAYSLFEIVRAFIKTKEGSEELSDSLALQNQKMDMATEKVAELNEEFKNFNAIQAVLIEGGAGFVQFLEAVGRRLTSLSSPLLKLNSELATTSFKEYSENSIKEIDTLIAKRAEIQKSLESIAARPVRNTGSLYESSEVKQILDTSELARVTEEIENLRMSFGEFLNTSEDKRLQELGTYFTDQAQTLSVLTKEFGNVSGPIRTYLETLKELNNATDSRVQQELLASLEKQYAGVNDQAAVFTQYQRLQKDNANEFTSIIQSLAPESKYQTLMGTIKAERELLSKIIGIIPAEQEELLVKFAARLRLRTDELNILEKIDSLEQKSVIRNNELAVRQVTAIRGKTAGQQKLIQAELESKELNNKTLSIQESIESVLLAVSKQSGGITTDQVRRLANLGQELKLNEEKEASLERQRNLSFQVLDAANQALEGNLQSNIAAIIKGSEKSFKDAILNIGKGVLEGIADKLAGQLTDIIMGTDPLMKAQQGAIKVAGALTEGAAAVGAAIKQAFREAAASMSTTGVLSDVLMDSDFVGPPEPSKKKTGGALAGIGAGIGAVLFGRKVKTSVEDEQGTVSESGVSRAGGLFSPLINFFSKTENPFFQGLKGIFSKDNPLIQGFGRLFQGIMPLLGKLFTGGIGGFLGFANGGMVKGGFQAYANGGIATKPTLGLVGEGRYNEAIVPMPNGKAIPVDMKGAGQQNNVTVNVSVDSQGGASTNMQQDSAQAGNLGQVIARAVQQELQNQKRSGGILNPYGAA
jgi:hypothetical protein